MYNDQIKLLQDDLNKSEKDLTKIKLNRLRSNKITLKREFRL